MAGERIERRWELQGNSNWTNTENKLPTFLLILEMLACQSCTRFSSRGENCPECTVCFSASTLWTASQHLEMCKVEGVPVITSKGTSSSMKNANF